MVMSFADNFDPMRFDLPRVNSDSSDTAGTNPDGSLQLHFLRRVNKAAASRSFQVH